MKRILLALLSGAVLSAGATLALASHDEFIPDECADAHAGTDISPDSSVSYTPISTSVPPAVSSSGLVEVDLVLHGASCLAADYSVTVYDENPAGGTPVVLDAVSFPGDGTSSAFTIRRPVVDDDGTENPEVCVNITVSTTQHVESGSGDTSGSSHPGGNGNAPPMQDSSTDTNSIDTETVVEWGAETVTEAIPCVPVSLTATGSGSRGFN